MIPILSNGHGGMIGGVYQTPGKRSPNWEQGTLYEGMFNRWFVNRLIEKLDRNCIPYYHVSPELRDVSLRTRVDRVNRIARSRKDVYFLDVHANAGGGEGVEGFTTTGRTKSDPIADLFLKNIQEDFRDLQVMRFDTSDGDRDKEQNFFVLRNTICPAFLLECGFMDHPRDYKRLWSEEYLDRLVNSVYKTIVELTHY